MENEVVDTAATEEVSTEQATPETEAPAQQTQEPEQKLYSIKVNGEEMQVSEPELIKYAQLGKAGQRAMERAAQTEKKQREMYSQLVKAAETDVYALYEVLTGKKHPSAMQQNNNAVTQQDLDPRDLKLREYEEKLSRIEQRIEAEEVEKERQAVETELADSIKKYPELDTPYLKHYIKAEYRKALVNGIDLSLDDVAFYVSQDVKKSEQEKAKATSMKLEENKKRAPVIAPPPGAKESKPMTLDDVKRLAGRI